MKKHVFLSDPTIVVTAKTRGIDAEREKEKRIPTLNSSSYATTHKGKKNRLAENGQNQPFWTK